MKNLSLAVSDFEKFVFTRGDQVVTTSNFVAEAFGKPHKNVLRDIDDILTQVVDFFGKLNFEPTETKRVNNLGFEVSGRSYNLTKDGFMLLVMGFNGKAAMQIKCAFLEAFNAMSAKLSERAVADDLTVLKLTAEKISAEAGKLKAEAEAAHLKYELAKLKQSLPKSEAAMPSEDLLQAPQAPVSPQKAFILEQPEGSVFAMDVSGCSVRFIRLDGLTWICLKDLCNACGMAWGAQLRSLGIGFGHRISLHRGSHAIFVSQDEAFDYLNQRNTNRVRHPEKLSDTRTFVKNLI
jgi:phage regulatory protein, rha family